MSHNIIVEGGTAVRLKTAGTYCDRDIVVTAKGGAVAEPVVQPLEITENGTYTPPAGVDGYAPVTVNVAGGGIGDSEADVAALLSNTMTELNNSIVTTLRTRIFQAATKLVTANLPSVTSIGAYGFYQCTGMVTVRLPKLASVSTQIFYGCTKLKHADCGNLSNMPAQTFNACSALTELIIRRTSGVCSLSNINAINNSPIGKGTGYVYVPQTMDNGSDELEAYKVATNWSTFAAQIRPLVDTVADLSGIDGTVYDRAWVDEDYCVYIWNGSGWEKET